MKQLFIFFSFLGVFVQVLFSQEKTLDYAYLKCQYHHTYLKDTLDVVTYNDLFILQIGKNMSKWYSYYTFQADSLYRTPEGREKGREMLNQAISNLTKYKDRDKFLNGFPRVRSRTLIYKNYPSGQMTITDGIDNENVIYKDTLNAQQWKITDSTKTILGYECQKAECDFRGRRWTAWFAPDVPVDNGPWKLGGLPGLIMEAYDIGQQYYFTMVGVEQVTDEAIVFFQPSSLKGKFREINRKEFLKAQMNQLTSNASRMEMETGAPFGNNKPVYRDLIERDYK